MIRLVQFINTFVGSGGAHGGCPKDSMYDIVIGHLTDHAFIYKVTPHGIMDYFTNFIFKLNSMLGLQVAGANPVNVCMHEHSVEIINSKAVLVFGIFDMRITKWVMLLWAAALVTIIVFIPLARKIKKDSMGSSSRWVNFWESLIGFVHDEIVEPNFDHQYIKKAMPYFLTTFFFLFFANYIGLIPGAGSSTGNLAVTGGLALFTFFGMIIVGTVRQGPQWIITGIVPHGIPLPLFPLLWVIELAGLLIKPFALMIRLFANMTAGHVVIIIFIYLVMMFQNLFVGIGSVTGSLMIFMLELLVCLIQAYIFTSLSAMFIGASMHAH